MGFFSEIASEARRGMTAPARQTAAPSAAPEPAPAPPAAAPEAPAARPAPTPTAPVEASTSPQAEPVSSAHTPPPPEVKLAVAGDVTQAPDDTAARQAHEAAEAKRKAEWDAQQAEKKATEQAELDKLAALSDDDASRLSAHRIAANVEKITRLNMKQQVADHLQALCLKDPAFARKTIQPRKSLARCFRYISRKAFAYVKDELEADGIRPGPGSEGYGCAVRDDLVYEWAENYYNDPNAEEDRKDDDEQFVPKPYIPTASAPRKKTQGKADKKPLKPKDEAYAGQITLGGFAPMEAKAG